MITLTASDVEEIVHDDREALAFLVSIKPPSAERRRLLQVLARMPSRISKAGPFRGRTEVTALALAEINGALAALQALG